VALEPCFAFANSHVRSFAECGFQDALHFSPGQRRSGFYFVECDSCETQRGY